MPTPSPFAEIAAHLAASRDVELRPLSRFPDSSTLSIAARGDAFIAQAHADPSLFLERYGGDILSDMLVAFDALAIDSYEVAFHLRRLRAHLMPASVAQIRNRRFRKLIQLQREGIYFADQSMADRDPILFHRYVVAHMPPAERHVWELTRSAERCATMCFNSKRRQSDRRTHLSRLATFRM
jgi:hypothetical protein